MHIIHLIGLLVTILYGVFLIISVRRMEVQIEPWILGINIAVGAMMILSFVQIWLGVAALVLVLPVALINGQLVFQNINWPNFAIRTVISLVLIWTLLIH
ncbi:hypothetical protein ABVF11_08550 [Pediococcus argentinicus]|uniref:hypothetical protein n=1 Tax=Pediococcus argentinicus TaxID=480391 RepID=UPI00338F4FFD